MKYYVEINPIIQKAIFENKPVVALESTIISHGMPYPDNVAMALQVEEVIQNEGATPATIAIIDGIIKVGLTKDEIEYLAKAKDVLKVSKRDFAYAISQKRTGATTVSATMIIAEMAGLQVFATGGIGGVHRGATETFDISRDLEELSHVNVCVVCAGAKSILDLGLTLEYLETKGVEIIGYQTKKLPAFYTRDSEFEVDYQLDSPEEIANLIYAKWDMGLKGGVVVANPIPKAFNHYLKQKLPKPGAHKIYFDYGTETLDAMYPPLQKEVDRVVKLLGYTENHWKTLEFKGANHSEKAWKARLQIPLFFLLN
jgi:pseudouridine-5'-phosphate glycosidase